MALFAVVDKAGLKAWLNPSNDTFIDIALSLLAACCFDVKVDQPLPVHNGNTQLL